MEDVEQTPLLLHNKLHKTSVFGEAPGFPGLGVPGQSWGRALGSQSLPMQVTGELVPDRQVLLGCAGGWEGLCPGDSRGMGFIQGL